jgi:hypothetical protein
MKEYHRAVARGTLDRAVTVASLLPLSKTFGMEAMTTTGGANFGGPGQDTFQTNAARVRRLEGHQDCGTTVFIIIIIILAGDALALLVEQHNLADGATDRAARIVAPAVVTQDVSRRQTVPHHALSIHAALDVPAALDVIPHTLHGTTMGRDGATDVVAVGAFGGVMEQEQPLLFVTLTYLSPSGGHRGHRVGRQQRC